MILTTRGPEPLHSIFANQFKCLIQVKLRVFVLKVAISGPRLTLYERNAIAMAQCQGPRTQMVRLFFVFVYTWQEDVPKFRKVPGAPRNVNSARAITWLVGVVIYSTIFNNNSPPLYQFLRTKYF